MPTTLMQGIINKGIILPISLIIIALVVTVLILALVRPKSGENVQYIKNSIPAIDKFNQLMDRYKEKTTELSTAVYVKSREASLYQDEDALQILQTYVATANKKSLDIKDYIIHVKECFSIRDIIGANCGIQAIEEDMYIMEDIINNVKTLKIKDMTASKDFRYHQYKQQSPKQDASGSSVYFKGCKTKEELIARYKNLAKTLHPDVKGGDTTAFQEMNIEYERLMKGFNL